MVDQVAQLVMDRMEPLLRSLAPAAPTLAQMPPAAAGTSQEQPPQAIASMQPTAPQDTHQSRHEPLVQGPPNRPVDFDDTLAVCHAATIASGEGGQDLNPNFQPTCMPLGFSLSPKVKATIWGNEIVDLSTLLRGAGFGCYID